MENKALIERFAALTDEQKERAKACKTPEEMESYFAKHAKELKAEQAAMEAASDR